MVRSVPSAVERVVDAITPDPDQLARGYAGVREIRARELAAGRPWPLEIQESASNGSVFSRTEHRPTVVANGLTPPPGCGAAPGEQDVPGVPCVPGRAGRLGVPGVWGR